MLTRNQIIESFYNSKDFCDCIKKMEPEYLQDDLKAEVILILLNTDETKLKQLATRKQLNFYAVRIIMNLVKSKTSPFYRKYRFNIIQYSDNPISRKDIVNGSYNHSWGTTINNKYLPVPVIDDIKDRETLELLQDAAVNAIETLDWYEREIIKLYIKFGNYRAIEKDTGIPWESCYTTIRKSINKIRCQLAIVS